MYKISNYSDTFKISTGVWYACKSEYGNFQCKYTRNVSGFTEECLYNNSLFNNKYMMCCAMCDAKTMALEYK